MTTDVVNALDFIDDWMPTPKAVMKLTVAENVTRRIYAYHIFENTPVGCYNRLVRIAIKYSNAPACSIIQATYIDEDGDVITMSSDFELVEAWKQFVNESGEMSPLRVSTRIVEKVTTKNLAEVDVKEENTCDTVSTKVQTQTPIEWVLTLLTRAVVVLQEQVGQVNGLSADMVNNLDTPVEIAGNKTRKSAEDTNSQDTSSQDTESIASEVTKQEEEEKAVLEVADKLMQDVLENISKSKREKFASSETNKEVDDTKNDLKYATNEEERVNGKHFIHARHTCDGCLKAPIIGLRYHAINLPDYDLCESCHDKYNGKDIEFHVEVNERDCVRQNAWKKRAARGGQPRRCTRPQKASRMARRKCRIYAQSESEFNEAVRRSLIDNENSRICNNKETAVEVENKEFSSADMKTGCLDEPSPGVDVQISEDSSSTSTKTRNDTSTKKPTILSITLDQCAEVIGTIVTEFTKEKSKAALCKVGNTSDEIKSKESKPEESKPEESKPEESKPEESKPEKSKPEKSHIEESNIEESKCNQIVTLCNNTEIKQNMIEPDLESNENKTCGLEEISSIPNSEMKKNQHEEVSTTISGLSEITNTLIADEECVKIPDEVTTLPIPEEAEVSSALCDLIREDDKQIQLEDSSDFVFETSEAVSNNIVHNSSEVDEKVVPSDQSVISENSEDWDIVEGEELQMREDEQLARAAQMVGSALFHSDMSRSAEALDNKADMDSILSSPESIGSLPTITSESNEVFMMKKWGEEINQLRELGFVDDQVTVDVLEALQAINVGNAVNVKATVADAIDQLLR